MKPVKISLEEVLKCKSRKELQEKIAALRRTVVEEKARVKQEDHDRFFQETAKKAGIKIPQPRKEALESELPVEEECHDHFLELEFLADEEDHDYFFQEESQKAEIQIPQPRKAALEEVLVKDLQDALNHAQETLRAAENKLNRLIETNKESSDVVQKYNKEWITEHEAAEFLGFHRESLARLRRNGLGPTFSRVGGTRRIRYSMASLQEYLRSPSVGN